VVKPWISDLGHAVPVSDALELVPRAKTVELDAVGPQYTLSTFAFYALLCAGPGMRAEVEAQFERATLAGKIYLATVLWEYDPLAGLTAWHRLRKDMSTIHISQGCRARSETVAIRAAEALCTGREPWFPDHVYRPVKPVPAGEPYAPLPISEAVEHIVTAPRAVWTAVGDPPRFLPATRAFYQLRDFRAGDRQSLPELVRQRQSATPAGRLMASLLIAQGGSGIARTAIWFPLTTDESTVEMQWYGVVRRFRLDELATRQPPTGGAQLTAWLHSTEHGDDPEPDSVRQRTAFVGPETTGEA
jgi:hypothetical protein